MASDSDEIEVEAQFEQFVLPHLSRGRRGPAPKLTLHKIFNYILQALYMGCQWKELPIDRMQKVGLKSTTRVSTVPSGGGRLMAASTPIFSAPYIGFIKTSSSNHVIHGDGTTTAAKKGGDNIGYSGHKNLKGDKVVAFCDRDCNVIAPFVTAPGNRNESPLLREALPRLTRIAAPLALDLQGAIVSLDGVYDCRANRKAIFNRGMIPNISPNPRGRKRPSEAASRCLMPAILEERSGPSNACSPGKTSSGVCCCASNVSVSCTTHSRHSPIR